MFTTASLPLLTTLLLAGVTSVRAHGHVVSWNVNGQDRPGFNPSYPPEYGRTASRPTDNADQGWANQYTEQVACGGYGNGENLDTWDVQEGSTITATWNQWPEGHHGPVTEYMARCPDSGCDGVAAAKLGWFKISEYGWDGTQWGSDRIHQTNRWSFNVPTGLAPGYYLFRHEITAMHTVGEPQVYPVCFQARLASSGSTVPSDTVTFPEALNQHDDFRRFNLYYGDDFNAFHIAGPDVWNGSGGSAPAPAPAPASSSSASALSASTPVDAPVSEAPAPSAAASSSSSGDGGYEGGYGGDEGVPSAQQSPSRSLVTSNAMATGKKYCRRRQPASEGLTARKVSEGKRQHVVNRYAKRSLRAH